MPYMTGLDTSSMPVARGAMEEEGLMALFPPTRPKVFFLGVPPDPHRGAPPPSNTPNRNPTSKGMGVSVGHTESPECQDSRLELGIV